MNKKNWQDKIEKINNELASKYPLNKRIWETIKKLDPNIASKMMGGISNISHDDINFVHDVQNWYIEKYPKQEHIIKGRGYKPFILKNRIYHTLINLDWTSDETKSNQQLKDSVDDMTSSEKQNLTNEDLQVIKENFEQGRSLYYLIHLLEVEIEDNQLRSEISELLLAGIFDINIALSAFKNPFNFDAQPIMFHAQQAVEKFLKALYVNQHLKEIQDDISDSSKRKINTFDDYLRINIGHNIKKLNTQLDTKFTDWDKIRSNIDELEKEVPNMNIRYKNSGKTIHNAIACIDLMINICLYITKKLIEDINKNKRCQQIKENTTISLTSVQLYALLRERNKSNKYGISDLSL